MYRAFERFCAKYERYGIKNLMLYVAVGNVAVFIASFAFEGIELAFAFYWPAILAGQYWRLLTWIFVPPSAFLWILTPLVIFFYYYMGRELQRIWGRMKLTVFYFTGMFLVAVFAALTRSAALGYELNLSLFLAFATLNPDMQIRFYFVLPIKIKWLALLDAVFILLSVLMSRSLLPLVPVVNYLLFFFPQLYALVLRTAKYAPRRRDFRRQSRPDTQKDPRFSGHVFRCHVCGITDRDAPEAEFRYCSRCSGKCYCPQHLFDHKHDFE
ncbi:MAG: hypothetical protein LBI44_06595 [Oscillospiraceae bacterium]|nr:hypothetical protein [Oscillospiraceae bacterium]